MHSQEAHPSYHRCGRASPICVGTAAGYTTVQFFPSFWSRKRVDVNLQDKLYQSVCSVKLMLGMAQKYDDLMSFETSAIGLMAKNMFSST